MLKSAINYFNVNKKNINVLHNNNIKMYNNNIIAINNSVIKNVIITNHYHSLL